jgi:NADPH-dependent 2,4-dienoyl-CoA reductase/sulfur reductase-like enzyme
MKHVILGNGPAGVIASETIRKQAPNDEIILVGAEPEPPYSRMAIPYLLMGKIDEAGTYLRKDPAHFEGLGIRLKTAPARSVNGRARTVSLDDGATLPFDRLLIATGSVPARLQIPGIDLPGVHPCWTLEDARKIMALAKPGARVLQMGAGFIGCIIMEAMAARGVRTDARMQTNVPGIYAAGDCAEAFDTLSQKPVVSAIQPSAADQASCAALNMAGKEAQIAGVTQINVLDTLGLVSTSFGRWEGVPGGEHVERADDEGFKYLRLEFDRDVLVGANAIGLTEHVGVIRGLIQARLRLGEWKDRLLRDPTLLSEAYLARAQAQDDWLSRVA